MAHRSWESDDIRRFGIIRRVARGRLEHWVEQLATGQVSVQMLRAKWLSWSDGQAGERVLNPRESGSGPFLFLRYRRYAARHLAVQEATKNIDLPDLTKRCCQCGKTKSRTPQSLKVNDGPDMEWPDRVEAVQWICSQCGRHVCRNCTLTEADAYGFHTGQERGTTLKRWAGSLNAYLEDTLCSKECWEKAGRPDE